MLALRPRFHVQIVFYQIETSVMALNILEIGWAWALMIALDAQHATWYFQ